MDIKHLLGLGTLIIFAVYFIKSQASGRSYLLFVLYFLPVMDINITNDNYGSITIFDFLSYCIFFLLLRDFIFYRYNKVYFILIMLLVSLLLMGSLLSEFVGKSLLSDVKYFSVFIYSKLLIDECYKDPLFVMRVIRALKFSCFISIVFVLIQLVVGIDFTFYHDLNQNIFDGNVVRLPSYFQDPQIFALFLSMSSFLFLINAHHPTQLLLKHYIFFSLVILVLFGTGGRSGFLGLSAGILLNIILSNKKNFRLFILTLVLGGYFVVMGFNQYFSLFNRQENVAEAYEVRNRIWAEAFQVFLTKPLIGIGNGNYLDHTVAHSLDGYYVINGEVVYYGTESGYLKILVELGILGFIVSLLLVLLPIIRAFIDYQKTVDRQKFCFIIGSVLSWAVAFGSLYTLSDKRILILLASLLCLLIASTKRKIIIHDVQVIRNIA